MSRPDPRDPWWVPALLTGPPPADVRRVAVCVDPAGVGVHPTVRTEGAFAVTFVWVLASASPLQSRPCCFSG